MSAPLAVGVQSRSSVVVQPCSKPDPPGVWRQPGPLQLRRRPSVRQVLLPQARRAGYRSVVLGGKVRSLHQKMEIGVNGASAEILGGVPWGKGPQQSEIYRDRKGFFFDSGRRKNVGFEYSQWFPPIRRQQERLCQVRMSPAAQPSLWLGPVRHQSHRSLPNVCTPGGRGSIQVFSGGPTMQ